MRFVVGLELVLPKLGFLLKRLATMASVDVVCCVGFFVTLQVAGFVERHGATVHIAYILAFSRMDSLMSLEMVAPSK